jgi:hypothetical protein
MQPEDLPSSPYKAILKPADISRLTDKRDQIVDAAIKKYVESKRGLAFYSDTVDRQRSKITRSGNIILVSKARGVKVATFPLAELDPALTKAEIHELSAFHETRPTRALRESLEWAKNNKTTLALASVIATLNWCAIIQFSRANDEAAIKATIRSQLKDPASARIEEIYINKNTQVTKYPPDVFADGDRLIEAMNAAEKEGRTQKTTVQRACSVVNAKNSFGGYAGKSIFHLQRENSGDKWEVIDTDATRSCEDFTNG